MSSLGGTSPQDRRRLPSSRVPRVRKGWRRSLTSVGSPSRAYRFRGLRAFHFEVPPVSSDLGTDGAERTAIKNHVEEPRVHEEVKEQLLADKLVVSAEGVSAEKVVARGQNALPNRSTGTEWKSEELTVDAEKVKELTGEEVGRERREQAGDQENTIPIEKLSDLDRGESLDITLVEGDLIILASDGLWDNLWLSEVIEIARRAISPFESILLQNPLFATAPERIAQALLHAAVVRSRLAGQKTPFSEAFNRHHKTKTCVGGKFDDITIVVAWVHR